jgi:hypothetical protein
MIKKTATQFLKEIKKEKEKYKLINGLFIVKYITDDNSVFIGDFERGEKTNIIYLTENRNPPIYDKKRKIYFNGLGWIRLRISFIEQDISEVLK